MQAENASQAFRKYILYFRVGSHRDVLHDLKVKAVLKIFKKETFESNYYCVSGIKCIWEYFK